jgi:hypothetical protein
MNSKQRIRLEQLEEARPYKPACHASDFAADKLRVLEALEQAGAAGLTTRELMDRGGGMRPPNRIHDLRDEGYAIKTIPEGRNVYRYVLCKFLTEERNKATAWEKLQRAPAKTDNFGRPVTDDLKNMPLFHAVTHR